MWALPQRYEKATTTLWKHDRYRYRYRYRNRNATATILLNLKINFCGK